MTTLTCSPPAKTIRPPTDNAAEQCLLASAWLSGDAQLFETLSTRDFVNPFHKWLLNLVQEGLRAGEPLDIIAVLRRSKLPGAQDDLGDEDKDCLPANIAEILTSSPTIAHKDYYFRVLREDRVNRGLLMLVESVRDKVLAGTEPSETLSHLMEQAALLKLLLPANRKDSECQSSTAITPTKEGDSPTENC